MRHATSIARYLVAGAVAFAAAQAVLFMVADSSTRPTIDSGGWFLNSLTGVIVMTAILAVAAMTMFVASSEPRPWRAAITFAGGATLAMMAAVFLIGPGNIFPIVMAVGAALIAIATTTGAAIAAGLRSRLGSRST